MEDDLIFFHVRDNPYFFQMKDILKFCWMEEDHFILANERRPQYFGKWKMTSIFWQMEDDINFFTIEDNLNFWQIEDDINILSQENL